MAPGLSALRLPVIGHGGEVDGRFSGCAHCAREATSIDRMRPSPGWQFRR